MYRAGRWVQCACDSWIVVWCSADFDYKNNKRKMYKKRLRLQEQHKKNVQDQRSVMVQKNVQIEKSHYTIRRSNYHTHIVPTDLLCTY